MDMALNVQHAKATGKKVARRRDVVTAAKSMHQIELDVYGRLDEMYELAEERLGSKEKAKEYINKVFENRKFMKDIHASHGKLSDKDMRYAYKYLSNRDPEELLKLKDKKRKDKNTTKRRRR